MGQLGLQVAFYIFLDSFSCIISVMCSDMLLLCHKNNKEMVSVFFLENLPLWIYFGEECKIHMDFSFTRCTG